MFTDPTYKFNHQLAQHLADCASDEIYLAGGSPEQCSTVYHAVYQDVMRGLGTPMPCHCPEHDGVVVLTTASLFQAAHANWGD